MPGGSDEKPFKCAELGCGQTFTNEDHLNVHRLKHQMSLSLTSGSSSNKFFFADQTPTPTKFLRYGEEIGLFNELNKNPFDEAFKTAAEHITKGGKSSTPTSENIASVAGLSGDQDTLNTPTPHIPHTRQPDTPDTPIKKRYRFLEPDYQTPDVSEPVATPTVDYVVPLQDLVGVSKEVISAEVEAVDIKRPQSIKQETRSSSFESFCGSSVSGPASQESHVSDSVFDPEVHIVEQQQSPGDNSVSSHHVNYNYASDSSSALMSPESVMSSQATTPDANIAQFNIVQAPQIKQVQKILPKVEVPKDHMIIEKNNLPILPVGSISMNNKTGGSTQYMLQVTVKTPEGKLMPVQIPAALSNPAFSSSQPATSPKRVILPSSASTSQQVSTSTVTTGSANASLITKMKLKEAIQQNSPSGHKNFLSPVTSPSATKASGVMTSSYDDSYLDVQYEAADSSVSTSNMNKSAKDDDPEEKRRKFLERNRAAATRCRNKKKSWVNNLERKAEELQATNTRLQNEVSKLRSEMAQLKALLLAHKDCPITVQQRNSGQLSLQRVSDIDTSDVQMIPVCNLPLLNVDKTISKSSVPSNQMRNIVAKEVIPVGQLLNSPQTMTVKEENMVFNSNALTADKSTIATKTVNFNSQFNLQGTQLVTIPPASTKIKLPPDQYLTLPTSIGQGQIIAFSLPQETGQKHINSTDTFT